MSLILSLLLLPRLGSAQMTLTDVQTVIAKSATRATAISSNSIIAIVDNEGYVLGVWTVNPGVSNIVAANFPGLVALAISKAGTASFLSSKQHAFTSRTAGFIVQQNFPPGIANQPPGPLVGVNFSNLPFSDVNLFKAPGTMIVPGGTNNIVVPVPGTSLAGVPGGVPLYNPTNGDLIGGVGVVSPGENGFSTQITQTYTPDEDVALAGQIGFASAPDLFGSQVLINGIRLPYVNSGTSLGTVQPFGSIGADVAPYAVTNSPPPPAYPTIFLGGLTNEIRQPIISDPITNNINGQARLSYSEITNIMALAANCARTTRAGIRLPRGQAAQAFITVVNNPNSNGVPPTVLGTIRTPGATMFSWDVAVQKARTAVFYSSSNLAFSTRTVGFLAQAHFPPGISGTPPGIFFGMQERFSNFNGTNLLNGAVVTNVVVDPNLPADSNLPNGITIFPGGFPLYRNGVLVGAIGVSGDGVDQDDLISASGTQNFLAPPAIRADQFFYRDARLPYAKFPRNPAL